MRGSCEATFRNRALASARCTFLSSSKRLDLATKCGIFVFPYKKSGFGSMPPRLLSGYSLEVVSLGPEGFQKSCSRLSAVHIST